MKKSTYLAASGFACLLALQLIVTAQPGSLDTTFGSGGVSAVLCPGTLVETVVQDDNKVVLLFMSLSSGNRLVRFNPDGTLDDGSATDSTPADSFGTGGIVVFSWPKAGGGSGQPMGLALQMDSGLQKIVVGGSTSILVKGKATDAIRIDRFLPGGASDPTFGGTGSVALKSSAAGILAVQSNQKIVSASSSGQLTRLNADGTLDATFGSAGVADFGSLINPNAIAIQTDGKLVIAGSSVSRNKTLATVVRLNGGGSIDSTFGSAGRATANFLGGKAWDVEVAANGMIVAAGTAGSTTDSQNAVAARFTSAGQLDASFGSGGVATYDSGIGDVAWRIALQPDGKVLVAGNSISGLSSTADLFAARFDSAGNADYVFGNSGGIVTDVFGWADGSRGVFIQNLGTADVPDYRVLLAGSASDQSIPATYAVLARYFF